jgi:hypothetical protein
LSWFTLQGVAVTLHVAGLATKQGFSIWKSY